MTTDNDNSSSDEEMACSQPLYDNAPLSDSASWQAIMHFALNNHLSMGQLLHLLKVHLTSQAGLPKNNASFRRRFVESVPPQQCYCSICFKGFEDQSKSCFNRDCRENKADICYFVPVTITTHFQQIVKGKYHIEHFEQLIIHNTLQIFGLCCNILPQEIRMTTSVTSRMGRSTRRIPFPLFQNM